MQMRMPERDDNGILPPYAWPGGYRLVYYTEDNGILCARCANRENESIAHEDSEDPQWKLVHAEPYYEGPDMLCDHCGSTIESAYGDPDVDEEE